MDTYTPLEAQILTARDVAVDFGADLLDTDDQVLADLSPSLAGGKVERNNYAAVHGTCDLQLLTTLDWTTARVRPWQAVTAPQGTVRRNLGVYLLTTPDRTLTDEDTPTYDVQGVDKLHILQDQVGDTYVVDANTGYIAAVRQVLTDAGATGAAALFDGTAQDKTLPDARVWILDPSDPSTWLRIANDLLGEIGYRGLWVDRDGHYRSEPYATPATRAPEWPFDLTNPLTNIAGPTRKFTSDAFDATNWWRFIRDGMTAQPTEGAGLYTVDRTNGGRRHPATIRFTAADQASLVAQGDQTVDAATRTSRTLELTIGPLPILGHFDVSTVTDPELGQLKAVTSSHTIPLDGSDVTLTLEVL